MYPLAQIMKTLKQEDDLVLVGEWQGNLIPTYREMLFFIFMIVLYNSGYARGVFWSIITVVGILSIQYIIRSYRHQTKFKLIEDELKRREVIK